MEFDEMKKIWDQQNNELLYAINEEAMHKQIQLKRKRAARLNNFNDFGLITICLITIAVLFFTGDFELYDKIATVVMIGISIFILVNRVRRKKKEEQYDRSILGDLDYAISSVNFEIKRNKTFVWWFLAPALIPAGYIFLKPDTPWFVWIIMPAAFILAYVVTRWELKTYHLPRKERLEALRAKLVEDIN